MDELEEVSDLSNSATVVSSFNSSSYLDTHACYITDIKLLPTGDILVIDADNCCAKVFKNSGKLIFQFGNTIMERPDKAVVIQNEEERRLQFEILISDVLAECIFIFDKYGIPLSRFSSPDNHPAALALIHRGNILITDWKTGDAHLVGKNGGTVFTFFTDLHWPVYAAASINGSMIITDWKSNAIRIFDCCGKLLRTYGSGIKDKEKYHNKGENPGIDSIIMPNGVVCDIKGNIFITDMGNQRIHVLNQDGSFQGIVATRKHGIENPTGIAINSHGELIVSNLDGRVVTLSLAYLDDCP